MQIFCKFVQIVIAEKIVIKKNQQEVEKSDKKEP